MKNYRRYKILATVSIGVFIVCFAVIMTAWNRSIYEKCIEQASDKFYVEYVTKEYTTGSVVTKYNKELVALELTLNYEKLADAFCAYFEDEYEIPNNELLENNTEGLNAIKVYYRWSVWLCLFSIVGIVYSMLHLYKGRYYSPYTYGGLLGILLLLIQGLGLILSDNVVFSGLKQMIFYQDYSFFKEGDVLLLMLPPEYARWLAIGYFIFGFGMSVVFFVLRGITIYRTKPHKF
ncbi:MAG: hypothetical protein E7263_04775 [Lachnospiraceae bacterium]|nr:hypothetical protein [Lachnospiraceae bacterium]